MITRQNGRKTFYQWDLDQKLVLTDIEGELDVHFWQEGQNEALVVTPTTEGDLVLVAVPNILLQNALPLKVYIWRKDTGAWTAHQQIFQVLEREKPADYVYTETEVRTYKALDERITALEANEGGAGKATEQGGEIFNDYENNKALALHTHAEGVETIAGIMAFDVSQSGYDSTKNKYYYVLRTIEGLEVGDVYSLRSGQTYINYGTITEIIKNEQYNRYDVYVDTFAYLNGNPSYLFVIDKPLCGDTPFELAEHSEGYKTQAILLGAHAEGCYSKALGRGSHAEGIETTAEHSAHAEGNKTYAKGVFSHAEGNETEALLDGAHAEGNKTKAHGQYSHAEGSGTNARASACHTEGTNTEATQMGAHAEGDTTKAFGHGSHSEGVNTQATGHSAHAEGNGAKATEQSSHAEGSSTVASGVASHAEGIEGTTASGQGSHAEGRCTKAEGNYSHAEGNKTEAKHISSHTAGTRTISGRESQSVVGKYNKIDSDSLFVVGNGETDTSRSNAFAVRPDGSAELQKTGTTDNSVITKKYLDDKVASIGKENWRTIQHLTLTEDTNSIIFSADSEGKPFNLKKARVVIKGTATHARLNTYVNEGEYVNVYFYSSLAVNAVSNYIYEIGEVTNALRFITLTRTSNAEAYLLADGDAYFKPIVTKNRYGENTPISHLKMDLGSGQYFLSGTEFIFEGVDEE